MRVVVFLLLCGLLPISRAFQSVIPTTKSPTFPSSRGMAPRFDPSTERWEPSSDDESASAGYPAYRSLLRHGPKALLARTITADQYDQAVLKFMANQEVGRWEAMGNMDRYFENAQDWAFERLEAERTGRQLDYVTLDTKQTILSLIWTGVTIWFAFEFFKTIQHY